MQRTGERPGAVWPKRLDDPSALLVPDSHTQPFELQDATELVRVTAAQGASVENRITDLRHGASCFPPDLLVQAIWPRTFGACVGLKAFGPQVVRDIGTPIRRQSIEDRPVESSWDEAMPPCEFQGPRDLLMPCIIPTTGKDAASDGVEFGDEQVKMELRSSTIMSWLLVSNEDDAFGVEIKLFGQCRHGLNLLVGCDVAFWAELPMPDRELFPPLPCIPNPIVQVLLRSTQQRDFFVLLAS